MITNLYYVTNTSNQNVFFYEIVINPSYYAVEVNLYPIPTSAQATTLGYTQPSGATWSYPTSASIPQMVTLNNTWSDLIGFAKSTTFPVATQTTEISYNSSKTPIISPVNTYIMRCNLLNSPFSSPTDIFFAVPINASFGSLITSNSSFPIFNNIAPNSYASLIITFYDQLLQPLRLHDVDISITLAIKDKSE